MCLDQPKNNKISLQKDLKSSMGIKEEGMKELADTIGENERKLDKLLKATAIDTEHIKKLENQLERGLTCCSVSFITQNTMNVYIFKDFQEQEIGFIFISKVFKPVKFFFFFRKACKGLFAYHISYFFIA